MNLYLQCWSTVNEQGCVEFPVGLTTDAQKAEPILENLGYSKVEPLECIILDEFWQKGEELKLLYKDKELSDLFSKYRDMIDEHYCKINVVWEEQHRLFEDDFGLDN